MKLKLICPALGVAAAFCFVAGCSSAPKTVEVHQTQVAITRPGVPGGMTIDTYQSSATVTAIDAGTRSLTVVSPNGATDTFKCGTNVINFDQIHVGDQIRATLTKEFVVFLRPAGEPSVDGRAGAIVLPAKGEKPGVAMAETMEVTATVKAVDLKRHEATLLFPDGNTKTIPVRPDVDLTKAKLGQQVVIRSTRTMALLVEKPSSGQQ